MAGMYFPLEMDPLSEEERSSDDGKDDGNDEDEEFGLMRQFENCCKTGDYAKMLKIVCHDGFGCTEWNAGLVLVAVYGHVEMARYFVERGAYKFKEAMEYACVYGQIAIVDLLLDKAHYGQFAPYNLVPQVCTSGNLEFVKVFFATYSCNDKIPWGKAIMGAIQSGNLDVVQFVLSGITSGSWDYECLLKYALNNTYNYRIIALFADLAGELLTNSAIYRYGIAGNCPELLESFLKRAIDTDVPLIEACANSTKTSNMDKYRAKQRALRMLIKHYHYIGRPFSKECLSEACRTGNLEAVKLLLENGFDIWKITESKGIYAAGRAGYTEIVDFISDFAWKKQCLIDEHHDRLKGACRYGDINRMKKTFKFAWPGDVESALEELCEHRHFDLVDKLIDQPKEFMRRAFLQFHYPIAAATFDRIFLFACNGGNLAIVRKLLPRISSRAMVRKGLLHAVNFQQKDIIIYLVNMSPPALAKWAMHVALKNKHMHSVEILMNLGKLHMSQFTYSNVKQLIIMGTPLSWFVAHKHLLNAKTQRRLQKTIQNRDARCTLLRDVAGLCVDVIPIVLGLLETTYL